MDLFDFLEIVVSFCQTPFRCDSKGCFLTLILTAIFTLIYIALTSWQG